MHFVLSPTNFFFYYIQKKLNRSTPTKNRGRPISLTDVFSTIPIPWKSKSLSSIRGTEFREGVSSEFWAFGGLFTSVTSSGLGSVEVLVGISSKLRTFSIFFASVARSA